MTTHESPKHFLLDVDGAIARVSLNRPERKNPLTFESYAELRDWFRALVYRDDIKVVIFGPNGGNFCSGGDVFEIIGPLLDKDMKGLLDVFAHDRKLVNDELAELRYRASTREGVQERFAQMFSPAPRQQYIQAMTTPEHKIRALPHETLVVHGREDKVIPLSNALTLASLIPRAQLHVYPHCGHWTGSICFRCQK